MISVYGPKSGYDSFEVVTRGYLHAASHYDVLQGWASTGISGYDPEDLSWVGSKWGLMCGPYTNCPLMLLGAHKKKALVIAPNSTWMPERFYEIAISAGINLIVVPSWWAYDVVMEAAPRGFDIQIAMGRHGLLPGHGAPAEGDTAPIRWNSEGKFIISHFANSSPERKGTKELIRAFASWKFKNEARLFIVANPGDWEALRSTVTPDMGDIVVSTRVNASPEIIRWLYHSSNLICQPSRAEGFGLVPLEALVCGVPVAMTTCTGHADYAFVTGGRPRPGVIVIEHGELQRVSYDPDGYAHEVSEDAIVAAIDRAHTEYEAYRDGAKQGAESILREWSWPNSTNFLFRLMGEIDD